MGRSLGSLGDFFPDTDIRCRIRGCNNVWQFSGEDALHSVAQGKSARPDRMCDDCFRKFVDTKDKQVPCSTAECDGTWTWDRFRQLESQLQGHKTPPRGFCNACRDRVRQMEDKPFPCRMRGCTRTWVWPVKAQLLNPEGQPKPRLCDTCFRTLNSLQDKPVPCRMKHCEKKWRWNRYQQLEHMLTGKELESPPRRMCPDCYSAFQDLKDIELPCKMDDCSRTWRYTRYEQLEHQLSAEPDTKPDTPSKMCQKCYGFFLQARDRSVPCKNRGCQGRWLLTRGMQLTRKLKGESAPVDRLCEECEKKIEAATPRDVECMVPGCSKTWPYSPEEQVRDACQRKSEPAARRCSDCDGFLATHEPQTLQCTHCEKEIRWSAYEQLLCQLGTFVKPERCTDCTEQELSLGKPAEPTRRPHHLVIRVPATGPWQKDDRIRAWPPHLTYDVVADAEQADLRIVTLGDDLTFCSETREESWPYLMEQALNQKLEGRAKAVVINAGIRGSTSQQALLRFARDVAPFKPHLVIVSFVFADSLLRLDRHGRNWHTNTDQDRLPMAVESLFKRLTSRPGQTLFWTTNPSFPQDRIGANPSAEQQAWARAQKAQRDRCLRQTRHFCTVYDVPILDLFSRFEVNGTRSAKKWMADWYNLNASGVQNVATWFVEHIVSTGLLPV